MAPGKFEGCENEDIGKKLYEITLDGGPDAELGEVDGFGWYGLIADTGIPEAPHVIVWEDNNGFFDYRAYESEQEARERWEALEDEYREYCDEYEV